MTMETQEAYVVSSDMNEVEGGSCFFKRGRRAKAEAMRALQLRNNALVAELDDMKDEIKRVDHNRCDMSHSLWLTERALAEARFHSASHASRVIAVTAERDAALAQVDLWRGRAIEWQVQRDTYRDDARHWRHRAARRPMRGLIGPVPRETVVGGV